MVIEVTKQATESENAKCIKQFRLEEIYKHSSYNSCWITIWNNVYDVTEYLKQHPGGTEIILEYAGSDATNGFLGKGHSIAAMEELENFRIGILVEEDRQYPSEIIPSF